MLKLRRYVTERLVDQIPNLGDLQRSLDELQIMEPPTSHEEAFRSTLVVEYNPEIYSRLVKGRDWGAIAAEQVGYMCDPANVDADVQKMSNLIDSLGDWEEKVTEGDKQKEVDEILAKAGVDSLPKQ